MSEVNPYAAPVAAGAPDDDVMLTGAGGGFGTRYLNQWRVVGFLTLLLGCEALLSVAQCGITVNSLVTPGGFSTSMLELSGYIANGQNVVHWLTLLPFGAFLIRANKNTWAVGLSVPTFSPASMVWWFFVPLGNFIKPFEAVREVWHFSAPSDEDATAGDPGLLIWWAMWLMAGLGSRILGWLTAGAGPETYNTLLAITTACSTVLCVTAIWLVRTLHGRQQRRAAEFRSE